MTELLSRAVTVVTVKNLCSFRLYNNEKGHKKGDYNR